MFQPIYGNRCTFLADFFDYIAEQWYCRVSRTMSILLSVGTINCIKTIIKVSANETLTIETCILADNWSGGRIEKKWKKVTIVFLVPCISMEGLSLRVAFEFFPIPNVKALSLLFNTLFAILIKVHFVFCGEGAVILELRHEWH